MKTNAIYPYTLALVLAAVLIAGCTPRVALNTGGARESDVEGTYRVVYYGCNFLNDFETVVFLDKEGDGYTFEPYAPDFNYKVATGVPAKEAVATAERFVNCNTGFSYAQWRKILSQNGDTLGYEVQPIYQPFVYGGGEALSLDYRLEDGKVMIYIRLAGWVERMLSGGGHDHDR